MALIATFLVLLAGGAAAAYTLTEIDDDNPGVAYTLHRFEGLLGAPSCCDPAPQESTSDAPESPTS